MMARRLAAFVLAVGLASSSAAQPVTWEFEGRIREIQNSSAETLATLALLGVELDSAFVGQLVFEPTTPDSSAELDFGRYFDAVSSFGIAIGSLQVDFGAGAPSNLMTVNVSSGYIAALGAGSGTYSVFDSPILELALPEAAPGLYTSDALPLLPPALAALMAFEVGAPGGTGYGTGIAVISPEARILGELTRLEAVPEPAIFALVALSLAALRVLGRRAA